MNKRSEAIVEISKTMRELKHLMHSKLATELNRFPVSKAQLELLFVIDREQPTSLKRLAECLGLTTGAISQLIDNLEVSGYIRRQVDTSDRRMQKISLSKKGITVFSDIEKKHHVFLSNVMSVLSTTEINTLLGLERKIINNLQEKK